MKPAKWFATLLLPILVHATPAHAQFATGSKLIEWSYAFERVSNGTSSLDDGDLALMLTGYVMSVADEYRGLAICAPQGVNAGQMVAVSIKYVKAHPEWWNQGASNLVMLGLTEAFPCRK